jgi:DHA1 family bicyclomycin/chloramphenicol resistance-like MFS transporter
MTILVVILAALNAYAPTSMDIYLPAFPQIAEELDATTSQVALTLAVNLVGIVIGQLVFGPMTDSFGRRRIVIITTVIAAVASLGVALSPTIGILLVMRFIQGLAGGAGIAIARAIAADVTSGKAAARLFSIFISLTVTATIAAPVIGGLLLADTGTWRSGFVFLFVVDLVLAIAIAIYIPETHPEHARTASGFSSAGRSYLTLLRDRVFMGYAITLVLAFASLYAYLAESAFVLQTQFGMSPNQYTIVLAVNSAGLMIVGFLNARLVRRWQVRGLLITGLLIAVLAGIALMSFVVMTPVLALERSLLPILMLMFIIIATRGIVTPNATVLGVERSQTRGAAGAVLGAGTFFGGILVTPFIGLTPEDPVVSMTVCMAVAAFLALIVAATMTRSRKAQTAS